MTPPRSPELLAAGRTPVYVATRLYDPSGRHLGAIVERGCLAGLREALIQRGLEPAEPLTFLPFRDSNAALDPKTQDFSRAIYDLDRQRVERAYALLAPLGDLQLDSGVAFEVGYAHASGTPVALLWFNFFRLRYDGCATMFGAPPLLRLLGTRELDLGAVNLTRRYDDRDAYFNALLRDFGQVEASSAALCRRWVERPPEPLLPAPGRAPRRRVHLEFGGGQFEHQRDAAERAAAALEKAGAQVSVARRYQGHGPLELRAQQDLEAARTSEVVVVWGDGADVDAEAAAVQGYVRGLGRRVVLYSSGPRRIFTGPEYDHQHNLMLLYSADRLARSLDEAVEAALELLDQGSSSTAS